MNERKNNLPQEFYGNGNKRKFAPSKQIKLKAIAEVDKATRLAGLRDNEVATMLGVSKQTYSRMKSASTALNMGNIEAIAEVLGYEVEITFVKRSK